MAIKITFEKKEYTLEYNRASILKMEKQGFNINEVGERPLGSVISLFKGAFIMHHPKEKEENIEDIFTHLSDNDKSVLIPALMKEFAKPVNSLMKCVNDEKGNALVEIVETE